MDAHAKGERAWRARGGGDGGEDVVMKMDRERETEANGRTRRREGRLQPTSHSSCVSAPGSYDPDVPIGDGSSIAGRNKPAA